MERKWTYLMFALGALALAFVLLKAGDWAWSYYGRKPNELLIDALAFGVAGAVAVAAIRNEQIFGLANEVTTELAKVTWPTRKETFNATIIVIITVVVSSLFLGLFDAIWSYLTRFITP